MFHNRFGRIRGLCHLPSQTDRKQGSNGVTMAVVGKLMKSVNFVNPWSVNEFVSFAKVNKLTFLSNLKLELNS